MLEQFTKAAFFIPYFFPVLSLLLFFISFRSAMEQQQVANALEELPGSPTPPPFGVV